MTTVLLICLKLSVVALLLAIGMLSTKKEVTYLWQRPKLLFRSLLAMYVLVPLAAIVFVSFLPLAGGLKLAIFVLAISAGAPLLPKKLMGLGSDEYVLSLVVTASVLAIFTVPAWSAVLGPLFGRESHLAPIEVVMVITKSFLLPLLIGMFIRKVLPNHAESFADKILTVAGLVLTVSAVVLLATHWQLLVKAGWPALLALASLTLISLLIGHLMGGQEPGERTALAVSCATRHLGLAILVAAAVPGPKTAVFIAAYMVASAIVVIPYLKWQSKVNAVL
ncbi:MAG: bile acid:Na+ symporter, BASS family [Methyloprofundus sp.]|nr:MAG: bile acid:Na+ symporter, BASS family [Methyloprofundus sp.]